MSHTHLYLQRLPPARRMLLAIAPALAGLLWLLAGYGLGGVWQLYCLLAALPLFACALLIPLKPLTRRAPQALILTAILALLLALPVAWPVSWLWWVLLLASAAAVYQMAGYLSLLRVRAETGMRHAEVTWRQAFKVATDEAVLGYFVATVWAPKGARLVRIARECFEGLAWFERRGLLADPADYHPAPPPLSEFRLAPRTAGGFQYEHLSWSSGYQPAPDEPGAQRWQGYTPTHTAHARIFRHPGAPRPWLVCIHGYRMGLRWIDFRLFPPGWLHHTLGLNIVMPVLPLHGGRRIGWVSGDGFMDGDLMDIVHAEAQAQWDLRRLIRWLRETQGAEHIAVLGYSLGGYNAALLSALESDLRCVIAAIPLVDIAGVLWTQGSPRMLQAMHVAGVGPHEVHRLLRVVSPLAQPPRLPRERRHIIAAAADRIVPLPPTLELWRHWQEPSLEWYQGTHLSVRHEPVVPSLIETHLSAAGLLGTAGSTPVLQAS